MIDKGDSVGKAPGTSLGTPGLRNKMHCWTITNNLSSIIFLIYFTNDNFMVMIVQSVYIHTTNTFSIFITE